MIGQPLEPGQVRFDPDSPELPVKVAEAIALIRRAPEPFLAEFARPYVAIEVRARTLEPGRVSWVIDAETEGNVFTQTRLWVQLIAKDAHANEFWRASRASVVFLGGQKRSGLSHELNIKTWRDLRVHGRA